MLGHVTHVTVYVNDQDAALAFYRDMLGFEPLMDAEFQPGMRWVTVRPPGGQVEIVLFKAFDGPTGKKEAGGFVHHHPAGIVALEAKAIYRPVAAGEGEGKGRQPTPDRLEEKGNRQGNQSGDGPRATIASPHTPQQQTAAKEGRNHSSHWQAA